MAGDDWQRHYDEQTASLRAQLAALAVGPAARRRRFRRLEYVCGRCGETVLEVMQLHPWKVLRFRRTEQHPAADPPSTGDPQAYARFLSEGGRPLRRGEWTFYPLADSEPDRRAGAVVPAACRCRDRTLPEAMIVEDMLAGRRKRTLPAPGRDD